MFSDLPNEIHHHIMSFMSNKDLYMFAATCTYFHNIVWYEPVPKKVYIQSAAHEGLALRRRVMQDRKQRVAPFRFLYITELIFCKSFQSSLEPLKELFSLPSLRIIRLGDSFQKPIHTLIPWLAANSPVEAIYFGHRFNQPLTGIEQMLHLKQLHFGPLFDQEIHVWPPNLECVTFRNTYNHKLHSFPPTLKYVRLSECYDHDIDETTFPPTLEYLKIGMYYDKQILSLPKHLKVLECKHSRHSTPLPTLPPKLEILTIGPFYSKPLGTLPDSLRILELGCRFERPLDNIPAQLVQIKVHSLYHERQQYVKSLKKMLKEKGYANVRILT
jgi:F-box-like/FNIP Repeat